MTGRILKTADTLVISAILLILSLPFLFPVFSMPDAGIIYKAAIVFAAFIFVMAGKLLKDEQKIETPIDGYLFMLSAWYAVTVIYAQDKFIALNSAVTFVIFLLFYYLAHYYAKKHFRLMLLFIFGVAALLSLYAMFQYFFVFKDALAYLNANPVEFAADIKARIESGRVYSTFILPNTFAGFLILLLPPAIGFFKLEKKLRAFILPVILLMAAALIMTKSRAGLLSLLLATGIIVFSINDQSLKTFKSLMLYFFAALVAAGAFIVKARGLAQLFPDIMAKLESYKKMIELIYSRVITGFGPGNFDAVYNAGSVPAGEYLRFAHNAPLQVAIELGVPGLIIILLAIAFSYRAIYSNFYFLRTPYKKILVTSLLIGITAFLIHNLFDFDIYNFELTVTFLFVTALMMSLVSINLIHKKFSLTYLLGVNPGKRRSIVFFLMSAAFFASLVTAGSHPVVSGVAYCLLAAGFAVWSVSKENIRRTAADIPLLLLSAWMLFCTLRSPYLQGGISAFTLVMSGFLTFYLSSQFLKRYAYKIIFSNYITSAGIVLATAAIAQHIYTGAVPLNPAFFPSKGVFSGFMLMPFAFILCRLTLEKIIKYAALKIISLGLIIFTVTAYGTKSGIFCLLLVLAGTWVYYHINRELVKDLDPQKKFKSNLLKSAAVVLGIILIAKLSVPVFDFQDTLYANKGQIFKSSLLMLRDNLALGWGLGSYPRVFPIYNFATEGIARYQHRAPAAFNELLNVGIETGLIGLALAALLAFAVLRKPPSYEGHKKLWASMAGSYIAVCAVYFHSLFDNDLHYPVIVFCVSILSSFIIKELYTIKTVPKGSLLFTKIYYFPALLLSAVIFISVARPAAGWLLYRNYEATGSTASLAGAAELNPFNASYQLALSREADKKADFKKAFFHAARARTYDSSNASAMATLARIYAAAGLKAQALSAYDAAILCDPFYAFTYTELALYYRELGDMESSRINLIKAAALEPNYLEARNNLALVYKLEKNYGMALKELDSAEYSLNNFEPASAYEKRLLDIPPSTLYANKAYLLKEMDRPDEACVYFTMAGAGSNSEELAREVKACSKRYKK